MKTTRATLVATAIPLLLTSLGATAGELPFSAPATEQAKESAPVLHQAARGLYPLLGGKQISNLWLFPTADANTVFVHYDLASNKPATSGAAGSTTEHLAVVTLRDNRIVESRELTSPSAEVASKDSASPDWTAAIGTGYAAHANMTNSSHGVPASPHWTASIGTGTAASLLTGVRDTKQPAANTQPVVATPHWTSRIGRGDAFDSSKPVVTAPLAKISP